MTAYEPPPVQQALQAQARQLAHAFGNPLAGLVLTLELLASQVGEGATQRQLGRCLHACEGLLAEQRVLQLLGAGAEASKARVDVRAAWQAARAAWPVAPEQPTFGCQLAPEGEDAWANSVLLGLALEALLRNAARAAGPGGHVCLHGRRTSRGLELAVEDDGPGVPSELRPRLFRQACPRQQGAFGVGLLLVALAIEGGHGGEVGYEPLARGSRFVLVLPRAGF